MNYRAEIDGLRTLAVLPVVMFHLGYGFISGGYYGVDVFFVISGYLISKILTQSIEEGKFSMFDFWIRRIKRLLPALLTVVLVTLIVTPILIFKPVIKEVVSDVFPAIFSYFNIHALLDFGNYWGVKSNNSFFLHVWSLSVEEQFYIFYPLFLFFSFKYFKNFFSSVLFLTLCSFIFFIIYLNVNKDFTFYMLPTRIWELSLGSLISFTKMDTARRPMLSTGFALTGILLILLSYFIGSETISSIIILPVLGAALILLFASPDNIVGKALSQKEIVIVGKFSYSIYLWHWIIIVLFKNLDYQLHHINRHITNGLIFVLTLMLSYFTFYFVESKTRNYKHTPKIVMISFVVISCLAFFLYKSFSIYYESNYNKLTDYFRYYDISPKQVIPDKNNPIDYNMNMPNRPEKFSEAYKNEGLITRVNSKKPELILFGDSHGVMWAKLMDDVSDELELSRTFYTSTASKPFFNLQNINQQPENNCFSSIQRVDYAKSFINNLKEWKPKMVIMACRWEGLIEDDKLNLNNLLLFLGKQNIKVLLLNQPPRLTFMANKNAGQYFTYLGIKPVSGFNYVDLYNNESVTKANNYLNSLKKKYHFVIVYDVFDKMAEDNKVKILMNNDVLYYDDDHLSYPGTLVSKQEIKKIIIENIKHTFFTESLP